MNKIKKVLGSRKEIEGDEYNEARDKYNEELSSLEKKKQNLFEIKLLPNFAPRKSMQYK